MRPFNHIDAKTTREAVSALGTGKRAIIAGGTDLLGTLKDNLLPDYPDAVVNVKSIPGLDYIEESDGALKIGALTRLSDIAENPVVNSKYTALAQAALSVATPHIRDMGTLGGSLAQLPRCWYFRKTENRFNCLRKGGSECFAILGDNRYHSAFGGAKVTTTPCAAECPAGTDIPGYFAKMRAGDMDGAARLLMQVNPMPALTSRVCAHFCQTKCNRCQNDESVLISGVERSLGDYILDNADRFYAPPTVSTGKSIAIVGSGPSGLSAAFYLRRAGNAVTVYDTKPEAGGMLMYAIPAYRLPKDLVRKFVKALGGMGIEFKLNTRIGDAVQPEQLEREYDSVCYTTGAWKRPVVGLAGEELTVFGLDFLVEVHKWMEGKVGSEVVVTGGGNVAMDVAVTAKRLGAKKVTMVCLEPRERMPASAEEIERATQEGIVIMPSWGLASVVSENGAVSGLELKRCVSPWDANGRFNPKYDESEKTVVKAENILMAVGQSVDLSFLDDKYQLQLSARGLIDVTDDTRMTSREGVFAGGDVTTGPATVIGSLASGHRAANGINSYLDVVPVAEGGDSCGKFISFDSEGVQNPQALKLKEREPGVRALETEDSISPDAQEALDEARRCMNCGCYTIHPSDVAPALIALRAEIVTTARTIDAEDFFAVRTPGNTVLADDELITEIRVPEPQQGAKSAFVKMAFRKSIDFPVVNCAVSVGGDSPRVVLNAVAPTPYRALRAEEVIAGKQITEQVAEAAGEAAVQDARPLTETKYKLQIAKTLVKRALLSLAD